MGHSYEMIKVIKASCVDQMDCSVPEPRLYTLTKIMKIVKSELKGILLKVITNDHNHNRILFDQNFSIYCQTLLQDKRK